MSQKRKHKAERQRKRKEKRRQRAKSRQKRRAEAAAGVGKRGQASEKQGQALPQIAPGVTRAQPVEEAQPAVEQEGGVRTIGGKAVPAATIGLEVPDDVATALKGGKPGAHIPSTSESARMSKGKTQTGSRAKTPKARRASSTDKLHDKPHAKPKTTSKRQPKSTTRTTPPVQRKSRGKGVNLLEPVETLLASIETMGQVSVCVHDLRGWTLANGQRQLPPGRYIHLHPFCMAVKSYPDARRLCGQSDYHGAHERGLRERRPFLKRCHAGVWEMNCPILRGSQIAGSVFCGVCRKPGREPKWRWAGANQRELMKLYKALPLVSDRPLREIGRVLHATLPVMLENTLGLLGGRHDTIRDRILRWLGTHYREKISIHDLARELHLSASRTGHLVCEKVGLTFARMVNAYRINEAKNLLRLTDDRITSIALQVGFGDSSYFSRLFLQQEGQTPGAFREERHVDGGSDRG